MRAPQVRMAVRDWREFDLPGQSARWDALAQWAVEPNPFFEAWFLLPALRGFDGSGRVRLMCLEADGELVGLMPWRRDWTYYGYPLPQWSTWLHANCFLGLPLVAPGFEKAFWRALLEWADDHAGPALFLHLSHLPLTGPLYDALKQVCQETGRPGSMVRREERATLETGQSVDQYLDAALGTKKRKELRRQRRRLAEEGVLAVRRSEGSEGLEQWIDDFLALESSGWKGTSGSALACSNATEGMFRVAMKGAASLGRLERLDLMLDGRPIAMLANLLAPPGAFSFKTAFDERYARYSPGVLLQRENLAMLGRAEIKWTDSCADADHPMIDHIWRERRAIGRLNLAIGGPVRRALFGALARRETGRTAGDFE